MLLLLFFSHFLFLFKARLEVAVFFQRYYRGNRDRCDVERALSLTLLKKKQRPVSGKIGLVVRDPDRSGVQYKIRRLEHIVKKEEKPYHRPCHENIQGYTILGYSKDGKACLPYIPRPKRPFLGYDSELIRLRGLEKSVGPQARLIQRVYRGVLARRYVKEAYRSLRHRTIKRNRAAVEIQLWYRSCVDMHRAMDLLIELKHEQESCMRIQAAWRGCEARKLFDAQYRPVMLMRRDGAIGVQRVARGFLAKKKCRRMKDKLFKLHAAVKVVRFFNVARHRLVGIRERLGSEKEEAAILVQKYTRRFLAEW